MRLVVNVHELAYGGVCVFLRGGERPVAEQFLDGAQIGAVGQQVRGESVAAGMGVQVPINVHEANILFDDAADGALGEASAGVIQKDGFGVGRGTTAAGGSRRKQKFVADGPVGFEGFLSLCAVGNDAFLVALA